MCYKKLFHLNLFFILLLSGYFTRATNYYFSTDKGSKENSGTTAKSPLHQLQQINELNLKAGDSILLAEGQTFKGSILLQNLSGTMEKPIIISTYDEGSAQKKQKAMIEAKGYANGIYLENCSNIHVLNIGITANAGAIPEAENNKKSMRCGVLVKTTMQGIYRNIKLGNLLVRDIFHEEPGFRRGKDEVRSANGTQSYGWGIRVINQTDGAYLKDILIENCQVENVAHTGIKFTASHLSISDIRVLNNTVSKTGGPGIQMSRVENALVKGNQVSYSGSNDDSRKWGRGSGFWCWGSKNVLIEHNSFTHANGPGDSAGCHIDFNCNDVVVQYNLSAHNAGGFCEILGTNYNCAYRYNISINDGHRVKGKNGAFQEGKIFWLSGFSGKGRKRTGPFNSYFYNNTIYVSKDIVAKIAVDKASDGVFIANNIFYFEGGSKAVLGDQYKPEVAGVSRVKNIVFKNNLYLKKDNWPADVLIQDQAKIFGNPEFYKAGGNEINNYLARNTALIANKGTAIYKIPGDEIGLKIGLEVKGDILGNPIVGLPDLGAIEITE